MIALSYIGIAQEAEMPHHFEDINYDFGIHQGTTLGDDIKPQFDEDFPFPVFEDGTYEVITNSFASVAKGAWVQLQFGEVNLGDNSYITITSAHDKDFQFLNKESIIDWQNHSAFFKGDRVKVELHVAPNDAGVQLNVAKMIVGDFVGGVAIDLTRSQCGPSDDRLTLSRKADGRMMPLGCTGWIAATGFYLTAGHCLDGGAASIVTFEFDVPPSLCDGTTQPAAVNDQYPIIFGSVTWKNSAGLGNDWGMFNCSANSNTGLLPREGRRAYYHLSKDHTVVSASDIRIIGYGSDDVPVGCGPGNRNSDSQTLQWHGLSSSNLGESGTGNTIWWEYTVDTEGGNSGSAISLWNGEMHAIGIHTNAGCNPPASGNNGTSFESNDLEAAMNTYVQTEVEYVDIGHFQAWSTGTSVRPHTSVQTACDQANAGNGAGRELILIAGTNDDQTTSTDQGIYAETFNYSGLTNGVLLKRTVGAVKIGPNATAFNGNNNEVKSKKDKAENGPTKKDKK